VATHSAAEQFVLYILCGSSSCWLSSNSFYCSTAVGGRRWCCHFVVN